MVFWLLRLACVERIQGGHWSLCRSSPHLMAWSARKIASVFERSRNLMPSTIESLIVTFLLFCVNLESVCLEFFLSEAVSLCAKSRNSFCSSSARVS